MTEVEVEDTQAQEDLSAIYSIIKFTNPPK